MTRSSVPPPVTAVMDAASAWLPARMADVEERLAQVSAGYGPKLGQEAEATLTAGGKRLRPILVLMAAGESSGDRAVPAATAVELVHMATLVHDDILDGAPVRRGRPTVVARAGRDRALGVGDLLLSRAFAELAVDGRQQEVAELSSASVALALGELAQRHDAYDTSISEDRYLERCSLKTARLFESACRVGRLASGAPGTEQLAQFGREIGLAFQLLDDVLDVTGPPERTGKARGTDLLDGTVTLPLILARRLDPGLESAQLRGLDQAGAEALCDRIAATAALDQVRTRAGDGINRAKEILASEDFSAEERQLLGMIADGVVERYS
jgi:geranylgeranyl pyrophosphate synthase